jgi:hypothetical protein
MGSSAHSQPHAAITPKLFCFSRNAENRRVALGRPPALGAGGPRFKSGRPDQNISRVFFYLKAPFTSNPLCGILADRRSGFASRLLSESSPHDEFAKTCGGRRSIEKVLKGGELSAHYLASMGKIQGTLRISRLIDHQKSKSAIARRAQLALRHVPLNCLRIGSLNLGSARSWRRFANSSCPVCTHHVSFVLSNLQRSRARRIASLAG